MTLFSRLGLLWCRLMHAADMWPSRGMVRCGVCFRQRKVAW